MNEFMQWPMLQHVSLVTVYSLLLYLLLAYPCPWLQELEDINQEAHSLTQKLLHS